MWFYYEWEKYIITSEITFIMKSKKHEEFLNASWKSSTELPDVSEFHFKKLCKTSCASQFHWLRLCMPGRTSAFISSCPFPRPQKKPPNICESPKVPLSITYMINCPNNPTRTSLIFTVYLLKNLPPNHLTLLKNWIAQMVYVEELQEICLYFYIKVIHTN